MNYKKYLIVLCMAVTILPCLTSCGEDTPEVKPEGGGTVVDPDKNIADPEGTVTLNMMVGEDKSESIDGFTVVKITSAYNFSGWSVDFVSIGRVKGLGNVSYIPKEGWNSTVAVTPGEGYVARSGTHWGNGVWTYTYARFYVVSEIVGTTGGVIGYKVKCQAPFEFAPQLKTSSWEFDAVDNLSQDIELASPMSFTVKSAPDWCTVTPGDNYIRVAVTPNISGLEYAGDIVIGNAAGTATLAVRQRKNEKPEFAKGRGTESAPWVISTPAQLSNVRNHSDGYFEVGNDIDLSTYLDANSTGWIPIESFSGHLDGKHHAIKGLWIDLGEVNYVGLFAQTDGISEVSNLTIQLAGKGIRGRDYVGGVCGLGYGTISSCRVSGRIESSADAGGICGGGGGTIRQCAVSGSIVSASGGYIGGIRGGYGSSNVIDCYVLADISITGSYRKVNGIGGSAERCYFAGTIQAPDNNNVSPISNRGCSACYYDSGKLGELLDYRLNGATGLTSGEMMRRASYQGWDFGNVWQIDEGKSLPTLRCFGQEK